LSFNAPAVRLGHHGGQAKLHQRAPRRGEGQAKDQGKGAGVKLADFDVDAFLARATSPAIAPSIRAPGVYAILLSSADALPLIEPGRNGLLYIGMTDASLDARSHFVHEHSGFSTFRRSLGALLKDRLRLDALPRGPGVSRTNVTNYRFPDAGERSLSEWMASNLLVAQQVVTVDLAAFEKGLIRLLEPPLNLTGWPNPRRSALKRLRAQCAGEASDTRR
jgi:hypothetical protein